MIKKEAFTALEMIYCERVQKITGCFGKEVLHEKNQAF